MKRATPRQDHISLFAGMKQNIRHMREERSLEGSNHDSMEVPLAAKFDLEQSNN